MAPLREWPEWVKLIIAMGTLLVTVTLAWSDLQADLRVEVTERQSGQQNIERSVERIEQLLREEMDRHHPRR